MINATQPQLGEDAAPKVAQVGELLIRAMAVLGTLSKQDLAALHAATDGKLPDCLNWALEGAAAASPQVRQSLKTHPPMAI